MVHRSRRPRATGFLGMVALVLGVEILIGTRRDLADPVAIQWRYRAGAVRGRGARVDVLCLGDSLVRYGVAAPVLGRKLGRSVANHAVPAAPPAATYFALRDAIDAGARPRVVVVSYAPFLLVPGYRLNRAFLPEMAGLGACLDLARREADPALAGALTLGRLVPSVRHREPLRAAAGRLVRGGDAPLPPRTRRPDLWLPGGGDESVFDWFYPPAWQAGAEHARYIDRLIDLAREHDAAVAWVMPPVGLTLRREWDALGLSDRYARFAASFQARHPNLVILDGRSDPVTDAELLDPLHLNARGAAAFTARVAEALDPARLTAGPRRVALGARAGAPVMVID